MIHFEIYLYKINKKTFKYLSVNFMRIFNCFKWKSYF